jgi:hypothetical protein
MPFCFRPVKKPDSDLLARDAFFRMVATDGTLKPRAGASRKSFLAAALRRGRGIAYIEGNRHLFSPACLMNKIGSSEEDIFVLHSTYRKRFTKCEHIYLKPTDRCAAAIDKNCEMLLI